MRFAAILAAGLLATACASAPKEARSSWGKAGVSYAQFLTDGAECALAGSVVQVDKEIVDLHLTRNASPIADPGVRGISSDEPSTIGMNDSILRARAIERRQRRAEAEARQAIIDTCLTERGYVQFRLTGEQEARLASLPRDSAERRRFLYDLGTNRNVLASQRI